MYDMTNLNDWRTREYIYDAMKRDEEYEAALNLMYEHLDEGMSAEDAIAEFEEKDFELDDDTVREIYRNYAK